jgi:hypothetical protein
MFGEFYNGYLTPEEEALVTPNAPVTPALMANPVAAPAPVGSPATVGAGMLTPPTMSAEDTKMSKIYNALGIFAGPQAAQYNPWEASHAQAVQSWELQNERMRQLKQAQGDNPFLEYETALQRGYFKLKDGESPDQGFLRYTQERFAPKNKSVYQQKMGDLTSLMGGNEEAATKLANGLLEVRTDPYGGQGVFDLSTGQFTPEYTPEQIAAGKGLIKGAEAQATGGAQTDWKVVQDVETNLSTLADEWEASNAGVMRGREALAMLNSTDSPEPGLIAGAVLDYLGIGSSRLAYFSNLSQQQLFEELGNATLTPVSDRDIQALGKLFASARQSPEVAKGNLEAFMRRKEKEMERKSGRMRREANRIKDADYRDGLLETYQPFMEFKAITSWDDVPGGE